MKILKYSILILILLNIPAAFKQFYGDTIGSLLSYLSFILLLYYYFLEKKSSLNWWMIAIGLLYYIFSSFNYIGETKDFIYISFKYFVVIICGYELIKNVSKKELLVFLLIGALSIVVHAMFFTSDFGRYSGLYLNANVAGFICITGFALTYSLKNLSLKLISQFIFTLMGLLTFSRTFIVIWVLLNLVSLKISIKNIRIFALGFLIFSTLILIDETVGLNNPRFQQLTSIANNETVSSQTLNEDSRTTTWAMFYDDILEHPFFGNGYGTFTSLYASNYHVGGVHNSYLVVIGESGILPFLLFMLFIIYLFYWSIKLFKIAPNLLMQTIGLAFFLLANHNFFNFYYITFLTMWIQYQIVNQKIIYNNNQVEII
jgi:O-antigen ligase